MKKKRKKRGKKTKQKTLLGGLLVFLKFTITLEANLAKTKL